MKTKSARHRAIRLVSQIFFFFHVDDLEYQFFLFAMHDLRLALFYSYIAYSISLPAIFCFLLFIYQSFSHFLAPLVIVDAVLIVALLIILRWFRAGEARPWLYLLLIIVTTFVTVRHMFVFISILYRTFNDFERRRAIFSDAVDRRVRLMLNDSDLISLASLLIRLIFCNNQNIQCGLWYSRSNAVVSVQDRCSFNRMNIDGLRRHHLRTFALDLKWTMLPWSISRRHFRWNMHLGVHVYRYSTVNWG